MKIVNQKKLLDEIVTEKDEKVPFKMISSFPFSMSWEVTNDEVREFATDNSPENANAYRIKSELEPKGFLEILKKSFRMYFNGREYRGIIEYYTIPENS